MSLLILPMPGGTEDGRILYFPVTTNLREDHPLVVTSHPVEGKAEITDHAVVAPRVIDADCFVSSEPYHRDFLKERGTHKNVELELPPYPQQFTPGAALNAIAGAIGSLFGADSNTANLLQFEEPFDGPREMLDALEDMRQNKTPCRAVTRMNTIQTALIESVSSTATPDKGYSRIISLTVREIFTASTSSVAAPQPSEPRGSGKAKGGSGGGKGAKGNTAAQRRSLLSKITGIQ